MRVKEVILYSFNELNDAAKENAINNFRESNIDDFWQSERVNSFDKANDIYRRIRNIEGEIQGERLYKWIINNLSSEWIDVNYISKHEDGKIKNCYFSHKYNCVKKRRSRIFVTNNLENYPLTGVCYDYDFLKPIIEFLKHPTNITNEQLADELPTYESIAEKDFDYYNSDEYIIEEIEANDYEFTEDGIIN